MSPRQAVLDTLEDYARAYCAKDTDGLMDLFVEGDDLSLLGTGADELCSGRAAIRAVFDRNFTEATAHRLDWDWIDVAVHGTTATVACTLRIHLTAGHQDLVVPIRWTVALIQTARGWKWVHRHASAAASSQKDGTAYPDGESP